MNIDELKNVELTTIGVEKLEEHQKDVLSLEEKETVEYLKFALDTYYKSEDEGDNPESVVKFFETKEFRPFYDQILEEENTETETTETETETKVEDTDIDEDAI